MDDDELATSLRAWRDRLRPEEAGLPAGGSRRAPGLRREEVAQLAGLSVDYLARLEQGRASNPSPSVLAPLARALRLTDEECDYLYRVAGQAGPGPGHIVSHLTPGVQRILDRLVDVPVLVTDPAWQIVASNPLSTALVGDLAVPSADERDSNVAWRQFMGAPTRIVRSADDDKTFERVIASDLRAALGRYPDDARLRTLIVDLRRGSPRFEELWATSMVNERVAATKTFSHPTVGTITVDCDVLHVAGSDLRVIVYTAAPGSPDARALALLQTVGLQTFSAG